MRIGVDIDDVLVDALPHFLAAFNAAFGTAVPLGQADWYLFRAFPDIPPPARRSFWMRLEEEGFLFQRPVKPDAAEAVRRLRALGHDLFLVTGRLPQHRAPTLQWLASQGLGDAFVEDERRTAEALVTLPLAVFLLDRPWNRGPARSGLYRVRSWAEIVSRLAAIYGTVPI